MKFDTKLVGLLFSIIVMALGQSVSAQTTESLYVNASTSTTSITSETNSHSTPDGAEASIAGKLGKDLDIWTFDFDSTLNAGSSIS